MVSGGSVVLGLVGFSAQYQAFYKRIISVVVYDVFLPLFNLLKAFLIFLLH